MGLLSNLESLNLSKSGHCSFLMDFIFVDIPLLQIAEDDFSSKAISVVIVGQLVCRISPIQGGVSCAISPFALDLLPQPLPAEPRW